MRLLPALTFILLFSSFLLPATVNAYPLISEISAGGQSDWVEITLPEDSVPCDISQLFVTMYYGTNEKISSSPVTLCSRDLPETPFDDRFAVVHFSAISAADETDAAGDLNGNGIRDLYCCNYGLWTSDCAVSIDTDDSPSNGGILDFVYFSNRDGSVNGTIGDYISSAVIAGEWKACGSSNIQECAIDISGGIKSSSTISRKGGRDSNSAADFAVTPYSTPGRENITAAGSGNKLFRAAFKKTSYFYGRGTVRIPLFLYETCSIKIRIFNSTGFTVYSSELKEDLNPGHYTFEIPDRELRGRILTGLYPVKIEAAGKSSRSDNAVLFLAIVRKRQ